MQTVFFKPLTSQQFILPDLQLVHIRSHKNGVGFFAEAIHPGRDGHNIFLYSRQNDPDLLPIAEPDQPRKKRLLIRIRRDRRAVAQEQPYRIRTDARARDLYFSSRKIGVSKSFYDSLTDVSAGS